jgi:iron complex outermembrane recepter protein
MCVGVVVGEKKQMTRPMSVAAVAALFFAILCSEPARAAADADSDTGLQEIVVTAQKRSERLQDVPQSVSVVTGESIERSGARDFHDILLSIPGVSYSGTEPGQSLYNIRGVSTAASNPTVGIYVDDISLVTISSGFAGGVDPLLLDMARVEVLKGPQGTLYGGSAMGGAIKYVTNQPAMDQFSASVEGGTAYTDSGGISYDTITMVNLPVVSDVLAVRAAVTYRFDAGYLDNVPNAPYLDYADSATQPPAPFAPTVKSAGGTFSGSDINYRSTWAARLGTKWTPDPSLSLVLSANMQRSDKANPDFFFTNLPSFESSYRFNQPTRDDLGVYDLTITKSLDRVAITSLTGYVDRTVELDRDYSLFIGGLVPVLLPDNSYNVSNTWTHTLSQEFRIASDDPSAALKWTLGIYFSRQRDELYQAVDTVGAGEQLDTGTDITYIGDLVTYTTQKAAFGDVTYTIVPKLDGSLGLRWFDINETINGAYNGVLNGGPASVDDVKSTDVGVTPKASLTYRVLDNHMVYAIASKGFRPGGPNRYDTDSPLCEPDFQRLGITKAPSTYGPDNLWTYELGSKNEFSGAHMVVNGAVYYTDWKKIQQNVTLPSCGFDFTGNVGAATIRGAELSIESAVGGGVTLGEAASYVDSRITQSSPGVSAQVGQPVLDTPKWTASLYGDYEFLRRAGWVANVHADYEFHGSNYRSFDSTAPVNYPSGTTGELPDPTQIQQAYRVVNTTLRLTHGDWQYQLYCDNLLNAAPYLDYIRGVSEGFSGADTLRPRTIGVSVKTSF